MAETFSSGSFLNRGKFFSLFPEFRLIPTRNFPEIILNFFPPRATLNRKPPLVILARNSLFSKASPWLKHALLKLCRYHYIQKWEKRLWCPSYNTLTTNQKYYSIRLVANDITFFQHISYHIWVFPTHFAYLLSVGIVSGELSKPRSMEIERNPRKSKTYDITFTFLKYLNKYPTFLY